MRVLVFQADQREPVEEFTCQWIIHPFLDHKDSFNIVDCLIDTPKLNVEEYDFFVITGSKFQVSDNLPWIHYLSKQIKEILKLKKPILGICFGHQLLAHALGGEVAENSKGLEVGTVFIKLTSAGCKARLFTGVQKNFRAYAYHHFEVKGFSGVEDVTVLASNAHSKVQAFCYKDFAWGVQFHPEIDFERANKIFKYRKETSDDRSIDFDGVIQGLKHMPEGGRVMKNFYGKII